MYVLGINGGVRHGYQDVAAVLVKNGEVVFALAEERLNRVKHAAGMLPHLSVLEALKYEGIQMNDIDFIATQGSTFGEEYEEVLHEYYTYAFGYCPPVRRVHHHLAHAASTYYASGFDQAMILTMDASGDGIALQKAVGRLGEIEVIEQLPRTNSLGIFYSMMTQFCGFLRDSDEYKLMGLAPYGQAEQVNLDEVLQVDQHGYQLNPKFVKQYKQGSPQGSRQQAAFSQALIELLGNPKLPHENFTQHYMNVAAATQQKLNEAVLAVVKDLHQKTGLRKLCLAGGVALNCETNRLLADLDFIDELFIQPASGDDGISLGAAWVVSKVEGVQPLPPKDYCLGKDFSDDEIEAELKDLGVQYERVEDVAEQAANLVAEGKIVGWFQGRDEYGPRALGNRSILANPKHGEMKQKLNQKVKFRESYRPFAPSVIAEDASMYFEGKFSESPHMTVNYKVKESAELPAITHQDQTARIQTVREEQNPLYYKFLKALKQKNGHGICLNTSFNRKGEPIVHLPREAVAAFYGSGMDDLFIGNFRLLK
jgi:carbamoyltransferase